ncbi:MAG: VCBS repeat-containing protein [Pseudomonadota bacterium]
MNANSLIGTLRGASLEFVLPVLALLVANSASLAETRRNDDERSSMPAFSTVEPAELFSLPGSLSNAWADFDGDGDPDLAVSTKSGEIRMYRNDAGRFVSVGASLGLPTQGDELRGLSWGDFDGDGDPDLFAGSNVTPIPSRSYLYRNDGPDGFIEIAEDVGLADPGRFARQANWVDLDNDGDLDLYAANRAGANRLYRANNGSFEREANGRGTVDPRRTVGACWFDYDQDGDLDLFLANQNGDSDALWRNDNRDFVDVAPTLGLDQTRRPLAEGGVGCAPGDFDNDGDLDLYVGTYGKNLLYVNDGQGGFAEEGVVRGLAEPHSVVAAAWGDYDNDGDLDLFASAYERIDGVRQPLARLLRNDAGFFTNVLPRDHPVNAADHGVAWIDFDLDGDIDLSLTDGYGEHGGHPIFRNELTGPNLARGFYVRPLDHLGTGLIPGAEVEVVDDRGRRGGLRLADTGGGYNSQHVIPVHVVAPADASEIYIDVRFPSKDGGKVVRAGPFDTGALAGRIVDVRRATKTPTNH